MATLLFSSIPPYIPRGPTWAQKCRPEVYPMFGVLPGGGPGPPCVSSVAPLGPPSPPQGPPGPPRALLGCLLEPPGLHWLVCCPLGVFTQSPGGANIIILYIFPMKTTYFWIAQNDQNDLPEVKRASLGPPPGPPLFHLTVPLGGQGPPRKRPENPRGGPLGP